VGRLTIKSVSIENMSLIQSDEFRDALEAGITVAREEVIVMSAFIKVDALEWFLKRLPPVNTRIVSRWQVGDLLSGASDLDCFYLCHERGIPFGIANRMHSKVYVVDEQLFVGSWNLTSSGLALHPNHNDELGNGLAYNSKHKARIESYLKGVSWLDPKIVSAMESFLSDRSTGAVETTSWPQPISKLLSPTATALWFHDLPQCSPSQMFDTPTSSAAQHTASILGIELQRGLAAAIDSFSASTISLWLREKLIEHKTLSWGGVTAHFHNDILDDPTPYRRQIKQGIEHLFSWLEHSKTEFEVFRPNHSLVVRLRS